VPDPTIDELFLQTLHGDVEDDDAWEAIHSLRRIGSREVFDKAKQWCLGIDLQKKVRGVYVMAQLGTFINHGVNSFPEESYSLIEGLLPEAKDIELLEAVINALGFLYDPRAIPLITQFADHPNEKVRFQVACASGHFPNDPRCVETLIHLMNDVDDDVRDWATFGLGSQSTIDSAEIRDALWNRVSDKNEDVRDEAITGLAQRKDNRAIAPTLEGLAQTEVSPLTIEAATWMLDMDQTPEDWGAKDYIAALLQKYEP
jgi:HEAT repeat protein